MSLIKYPYTNLHELNLDWIIEQLNNQDGPVRSVNGKFGIVTLTGEDLARSSSNPETVSTALTTQGTSIQTVRNQIGVTPLPTTAQTLTGAIAENAQEIADVEDNVIGSTALPTTAQTLTGAIAENAQTIANVEDNVIGNTTLPTTAQTLTGAIAENAQEISNVEDNVIGNTALPTTAQTLTGAIAELNTNMTRKSNIIKGTIASGSTETKAVTLPCLVVVARASASTNPTMALIDSWASAIYLSNNPAFAVSATTENISITNTIGTYASYEIIY